MRFIKYLCIVLSFGFVGAMGPVAYGSIAVAPTAPLESRTELKSKAACAMILNVKGVTECHIMDFTAFDVVVPGIEMQQAKSFCFDVAKAISRNFEKLSGKTYKVRIFSDGVFLTKASCRVPYFSH